MFTDLGVAPAERLEHGSSEQVTGITDGESLAERQATAEQGQPCYRKSGWPTMSEAAFYGPLGRLCDILIPTSEADRVGLLLNLLVMIGSAIGRGPFVKAGAPQYSNLFITTVGRTSTGRKGTATEAVREVMKNLSPGWVAESLSSGLSTAEGLISRVTDGSNTERAVPNKTVTFVESEFAAPLRRAATEGNTLGEILRDAADGLTLRTTTRRSPQVATDPHVSVISHITPEEFRAVLSERNKRNGFINRFVVALVDRSKLLPDPVLPDSKEYGAVLHELRTRLNFARGLGSFEITRDVNAAAVWRSHVYRDLSAELPSALGTMTTRKAAHTLKIAMIFALMDGSRVIAPAHLVAGLAVVAYCVESVALLFGEDVGGRLHDRILSFIEERPAGCSRSELSARLGRHQLRRDVTRAINDLVIAGRICVNTIQTPGRPVEILSLNDDAKSALSPLRALVDTLSALFASSSCKDPDPHAAGGDL